jgi:hypothetical protein
VPQGDGNARARLDEMTLTEWFAHLDHLLPHVRVASSDLTCVDDGARGGRGGAGREAVGRARGSRAATRGVGRRAGRAPPARAPPADFAPPPRRAWRAGHCTGQVEGVVSPAPLPAHVRLNFSCNVVVVSRNEVLETYERAINVFSRPVDPEFETGTQQARRVWGVKGRRRRRGRRAPSSGARV